MRKVVFASWNPKKAVEIQRIAPKDMKIICLKDIPEAKNIPRANLKGKNALENARIKAEYWSKKLNMPVLAEKSGFEIEALNGYPGVNNKKCIEDLCPDVNVDVNNPEEFYPMLLKLMNESGNKSKKATWRLAMAYTDKTTTILCCNSLQGNMCACAGERKFGFDQYFKPNGKDKTLSELEPEDKDEISPRKLAFEGIRSHI